jgi:hypothetical protein
MWKIETNEGLGQGWLNPNSLEKEKKKEKNI